MAAEGSSRLRRAVTATTEKAGRTFEDMKQTGERNLFSESLRNIFGFFYVIFRFFLKVGILVIGLGLIFYLIYVWGFSGVLGAGATHAQVAAESGIVPFLKSLGLEKLTPSGALQASSFNAEVEKNAENSELGLRITKLEPFGKIFSGEPIEIIGTLKAASPTDNMEIEVSCSLDDYSGEKLIEAEVLATGAERNRVIIQKDQNEIIQATCYFPKGINVDEDEDQFFTAKKVTMYTSYNFKTAATHKVYTLAKEEKLAYLKRGIDSKGIFDEAGIKDPLLTYDGKIRSKYTYGPIALAIATEQSQPLTEDTTYIFKVGLTSNSDWHGNIKSLQNLEIQVPHYFTLQGDPGFIEDDRSQCAFSNTGNTIEDSNSNGDPYHYKVYKLRDSELNQMNADCSVSGLKDSPLTRQDCIEIFKQRPFRCKFKIENHAPPTLQWDEIRAIARYNYETEMSKAINIIKIPEGYKTPAQRIEEKREEAVDYLSTTA